MFMVVISLLNPTFSFIPQPLSTMSHLSNTSDFDSTQRAKDEYEKIAADYVSRFHQLDVVTDVEEYTLQKSLKALVTTRLQGKASFPKQLDLACGGGRFARRMKLEWQLVDSYHGVDLSPKMILQAQSALAHPAVTFQVGDGTSGSGSSLTASPTTCAPLPFFCVMRPQGKCSLKCAGLFYVNLNPVSGVFLTSNASPVQKLETYESQIKYGYRKFFGPGVSKVQDEIPDFTPFTVSFVKADRPTEVDFEFTNYYMREGTIFSALKESGFRSVRFVKLEAVSNQEHFKDFLTWQPFVIIEALV